MTHPHVHTTVPNSFHLWNMITNKSQTFRKSPKYNKIKSFYFVQLYYGLDTKELYFLDYDDINRHKLEMLIEKAFQK